MEESVQAYIYTRNGQQFITPSGILAHERNQEQYVYAIQSWESVN